MLDRPEEIIDLHDDIDLDDFVEMEQKLEEIAQLEEPDDDDFFDMLPAR